MQIIIRVFALICIFYSGSGQQPTLPTDELESLKVIAATLGKTGWDLDKDPCTIRGELICQCTKAICHVDTIILRSQNLSGSLPRELIGLPSLRVIDLSWNYLNGTIPPEWGAMRLSNISLDGNRITGPIPKELSNISTLANLTLKCNQLSGTIPPEVGKLVQIESLQLSSNNLTGEIPASLARLTALKEFHISDNNFNGQIPDFIQKWTNIETLMIQASGLTGPIPQSIASLTKLVELRISDINGNESTFPPLKNIANIRKLVLKSCNLVGKLPDYIGQRPSLKLLDLSFNNLSGPIPEGYSELQRTDYIYLTGNSLNGTLPEWMTQNGEYIDLSYNNFTTEVSEANCQPRTTNLFASSKGHTTGIASCLRDIPCEKSYSSLHINCGGGLVDDEGIHYEADTEYGSPTMFATNRKNWGCSSTGNLLEDDGSRNTYIVHRNSDRSRQSSPLYTTARLSPLSLTYYAFCLANGVYTVQLHFAEIIFTDDSTFLSLGRRLFDVFIQGERVLKDFNIENIAGGVDKVIVKHFTAHVSDGTLDIRFYWAGKGTRDLPFVGGYGPLISAISIKNMNSGKGLSTGAIVGIVAAILVTVFLFLAILWWMCCLRHKNKILRDLKGLELHTGLFSLRQIKTATNNFDPANKIGEGGFGPVYKGLLSDGSVIALKQLSAKSKQGSREFVTEIAMISALQHPHLVKLYGCCIEGDQLLLVYEYMENNSLARALFGRTEPQLHLDWQTRHKICIGIARGLAYLHEGSRLKIVHRDIKATNVLLDGNLVPKISDFGLARLDDEEDTHISTRIAGTFGYMAPEYAMRGYLTDKADVYSFGVVVLEVVSGRSNSSGRPNETSFYLLDWANSLKEKGNLLELVDPRLESNFNKEEVLATINIALLCTNAELAERPSMSAVVSMLEAKHGGSSIAVEDKESHIKTSIDGEVEMVTMDVSSSADLYPISLTSEYWRKRDP